MSLTLGFLPYGGWSQETRNCMEGMRMMNVVVFGVVVLFVVVVRRK